MPEALGREGVPMKVKVVDNTKAVRDASRRATFKNLKHAGAAIRLVARRSIRKRKDPSAVGAPPSTQTLALRNSIIFEMDGWNTVVIGPSVNLISDVAAAHEHGRSQMPRSLKGKTQEELLTAGTNWKLEVGGHGPIGDAVGDTAYIKFRTPAQVAKSVEFIETAPPDAFGNTNKLRTAAERRQIRARMRGKAAKYPKRPFMGPALMNQKDRIPSLWADSVN